MTNNVKQPKVIGGINWSTRFKSKTFWVASISALAVFSNQITSAFGMDYSVQIEQTVNIVGSILTLLAGIGIVVDNNSKGLIDSGMAQELTKPRNEYIDPVEFKSKIELDKEDLGILTPIEYENPEPDTDDSDEVSVEDEELFGGSEVTEVDADESTRGRVFAEEEIK